MATGPARTWFADGRDRGCAVALERVSVAYPGPDGGGGTRALDDVSLHLPAGRSLGLVGRTGSGKTTLARLLPRLGDPTAGAVLMDGIDLRDMPRRELAGRVVLITQEVPLFGSTVRDNVTLFRTGAGDDRLMAALAAVGLAGWCERLPDRLDTLLGPSGVGISAGQRQLLALARAFLADPDLVVLDEASSRLDPSTERQVERAVEHLLEGRTAVVVAHRLSSLARMDEIAVLEGGRLVERGPRRELAADPATRFAHLLEAAGGGR